MQSHRKLVWKRWITSSYFYLTKQGPFSKYDSLSFTCIMLVHGTGIIDIDNGWMQLVFIMYFLWQEIISSTYTFDVTIYGSMKIGK